VCADVVIRAFRGAGIDLQQEVHRDMQAHFAVYPRLWGLSAPDANIDHRRVPNLMTFFERHGRSVRGEFRAGDVVAWRLMEFLATVPFKSEGLIKSTHYLIEKDPLFYLWGLLFALAVGMTASLIPAWRGSRVEPLSQRASAPGNSRAPGIPASAPGSAPTSSSMRRLL